MVRLYGDLYGLGLQYDSQKMHHPGLQTCGPRGISPFEIWRGAKHAFMAGNKVRIVRPSMEWRYRAFSRLGRGPKCEGAGKQYLYFLTFRKSESLYGRSPRISSPWNHQGRARGILLAVWDFELLRTLQKYALTLSMT
jgi:hypothetical protein